MYSSTALMDCFLKLVWIFPDDICLLMTLISFFASSSWVGYIIFSIICSVMMKERVIGNNTSKCFCPSPCWISFLFTIRKDKFLTNWHCQYQRIRKRNSSQRNIYEFMWLNIFKTFWYILMQLSIITIYCSTTLYKK